MSESAASEALGWTRTVLSTTLRRLDAGGGLNTDTLPSLEKLLGRSSQWIMSGIESEGVKLRDCAGWATAATLAAERYGLTSEQIGRAGATVFTEAPRYLEPSLIRALVDAM